MNEKAIELCKHDILELQEQKPEDVFLFFLEKNPEDKNLAFGLTMAALLKHPDNAIASEDFNSYGVKVVRWN